MKYFSTRSVILPGVSVLCLALMSLLSPALAAGKDDGHHGDNGHHGGAIGKPGKASSASRTVEVLMGDNYYEPESLSVEPGETVRFVVKNDGGLVHEFNIGTAEMHEAHQEEMMMMVEHGVIQGDKLNREMMKMDMGGGKTMEHNDPNSALLAPGEETEIVWTFPEGGELEFACNVPGHYQSGMAGEISIVH